MVLVIVDADCRTDQDDLWASLKCIEAQLHVLDNDLVRVIGNSLDHDKSYKYGYSLGIMNAREFMARPVVQKTANMSQRDHAVGDIVRDCVKKYHTIADRVFIVTDSAVSLGVTYDVAVELDVHILTTKVDVDTVIKTNPSVAVVHSFMNGTLQNKAARDQLELGEVLPPPKESRKHQSSSEKAKRQRSDDGAMVDRPRVEDNDNIKPSSDNVKRHKSDGGAMVQYPTRVDKNETNKDLRTILGGTTQKRSVPYQPSFNIWPLVRVRVRLAMVLLLSSF